MPIRFRCEQCDRGLGAHDHMVGKVIRCPGCGHAVTVPQPEGEPVVAQPAATEEEEVPPVRFRTKSREDEGVDMTPMVDVTFLLLIFFMVTASFSLQKSLETPSPDQEESSAQARTVEEIEQDDDYVVIRIARDNTVWVDDREAPSKQDLLVKIREATRGYDTSGGGKGPSSLLVLADGESRQKTVIMALDAGNAVGMENIRLATVDEEEF